MRDSTTNTIAQLLFIRPPALNFAHVVSELDAVLARYPADRRSLSWDCDDVAVFDLDGSRIVLGYADDRTGQYAACLTVSVGHGTHSGSKAPLAQRRGALCRKIADRLSTRYATDAVLWHETHEPVTPEAIERLLDTLPGKDPASPAEPAVEMERLMARMSAELEVRLTQPHARIKAAGRAVAAPFRAKIRQKSQPARTPPASVPANPAPHPILATPLASGTMPATAPKKRVQNHELIRVRAALYPEPEFPVIAAVPDSRPSTQMRLAVHAMNATMIVVLMPLGAAAMTYSILRGEDLRLSGRLMVLTGTSLALSQSSLGQHLMSMI